MTGRPAVPAWAFRAGASVVAATCVASSAIGQRIELRDGTPAIEGAIVRFGADGVVVRPGSEGVERTLPWSAIRGFDGDIPAGASVWLEAGEDLWRGRLRAERGDWALALEPLSRAARRWDGQPPSDDGLVAAAALAEALLRAGRAGDAVRPAFEAVRLTRASPELAGRVSGPGAEAVGRLVDAGFPVPVSISPVAFDAESGARVREAMQGFTPAGDPALAAVAAAFSGSIEGAPPGTAGKLPSKPSPDDRRAFDALRAVADARSADARVRAAAVASLLAPSSGIRDWLGPTARFAAGRAAAADRDPATRTAGRVLLASVAAAPGPAGVGLAARAAAEFDGCSLPAPDGGSIAEVPGAALPAAAFAVPREAADATAEWLESRREPDLLLAHLEGQVAVAADAPTRIATVSRLAAILAARLEREDDESRRDALLARALSMVERHAEGSEELRLAVLRSQHRAAQRTAEDRRAGRGSDDEASAALGQFRRLGRELADLAKAAERARSDANRGATFQVGAKADELVARSARAEEIGRSAQYFRAWASYYAAWLGRELSRTDWRADANAAVAAFAGLIEPGRSSVDPKDVSADLRSSESFSSAILGMALAYALLDDGPAADAWFALLEAPGVHPSVRGRLGAWRLAAALDRGDLVAALLLLRAEADGPSGATASLVAAARAGRDTSRPGAAELLTEAVGNLAAAGRLRDLASMELPAGAESSGAGARLVAAVRAVTKANSARDAGDIAAAEAAWSAAAIDLAAAAGPDAPPSVASGARALLGYVLRSAGRLQEAADAFLAAASRMQGERAGDARWNAVLCLDELSRSRGAAAADAGVRRDREIDALGKALPGTRAAVRAAAWRVTHDDLPDVADIDALLADAVAADIAPAARRAALDGLYRRFRAASGNDRAAAARRAILVGDGIAVGAGPDGVLELRRRLEMSIAAGDRVRAEDAVAAIEARTPEASMAPEQRDELRARRVQVCVLAGRIEEARTEFERLPREGAWTRVAARALADATFGDPSVPPQVRASVARAIVVGAGQAGDEDLLRWVRAESALLRAGSPALDAEGAAAALAVALGANPSSFPLLLADAAFRAARGDAPGSLRSVRAVLARAPAGCPEWFEAKALQVEAIAAEDPRKARAVLEQVRQLGNGFGGGPAGDRLRSFDQSLPPAAGKEPRP